MAPVEGGGADANAMQREKNNLVKKRGTVKGVMTRYVNELNDELALRAPRVDKLQSFIAQLQPREKQLIRYDEELADILERPDYEADVVAATTYYSNYLDVVHRTQRKIEDLRNILLARNQNDENNRPHLPPPPVERTVRLPKLEIKKFSGSYREWPSFWSHFEGAIHGTELSDRDKFQYLHSYLEGDAARAIQGLDVTEANYDSAITILRDRFDQKGLIISEHLDKFVNLKKIASSNNVCGLRRLLDTCEIEIRRLQSIGVNRQRYSTFLGHLIFGLLPSDLAIEYSRQGGNEDEIDVDDLLRFLRIEISCRERAFAINKPETVRGTTEKTRHDFRNHRVNPQPASAASLTVGIQPPKPCPFCEDSRHSSEECKKYTVNERREIAAKRRFCFICLKDNHRANRCNLRNRRACRLCNRKHHVSLCDSDLAKSEDPRNQNQNTTVKAPYLTATTGVQGQTSNTTGSGSGHSGVQLSSITKEPAILLQTALVLAVSQETGKISPIRCLLDPGAHRSFIKQDVSRKLGLQVVGEEEIDVYGFENNSPIKVKRRRVRVLVRNLREPTKSIVIEALETPSVTGAMFSVPGEDIRRKMEARGLSMADAFEVNGVESTASMLDLLIGTEFYWRIMTTKTERFTDTLVAMESIFGWVIHGPTSVGVMPVGINTVAIMKVTCGCEHEELLVSKQLEAFWELDSIGIQDNEKESDATKIVQMMESFKKNILYREGRYEVSFPWKLNRDLLGDNYAIAAKRTENLLRKLRADPQHLQRYDDVIQDQLKTGIVEEATNIDGHPVFYLPHRAEFLRNSKLPPPTTEVMSEEVEEAIQKELKLEFREPITQALINAVPSIEIPDVPEIEARVEPAIQAPRAWLNIENFSSLTKVNRITVIFVRFIKYLRTKTANPEPITADEIAKAEKFWVRTAQQEVYPEEIKSVNQGKEISKNSKIKTLNPILDQHGLLRVGGRLRATNLSYCQKHPLISPSSHHLAKLIAYDSHCRVLHGAVNETLVQIREQFWIIKGRQLTRRLINDCCVCRRFLAKPSATIMAPLPASRAIPAATFEVTGLDLAGPLYNREGSKMYIVLFTCAVTRAIHLELISSMATENFLLAFRRFVARRAIPKKIFSDNAKYFKRADADLRQLFQYLKSPEVTNYFGELRISWQYITDRACWHGGFWERMVRSVKNALRKTLGLARLTHEELETALTEAEAAINSRPISFVYQDAGEPVPLTPAHFIVGKRLTALPSRSFPENLQELSTQQALEIRWKYLQKVNERFWRRWTTDYLLELRSAHHLTKCTPTRPLQKGDIVIISDSNIPRLCWKTAIIDEAFVGLDDETRSCMLRLPNGTRIHRPIQMLYLLETYVNNA